MNLKSKLLLLISGLIASMYFWIAKADLSGFKVISMLMLTLLSYLVGRVHARYLEAGGIRARGENSENSEFSFNGLLGG